MPNVLMLSFMLSTANKVIMLIVVMLSFMLSVANKPIMLSFTLSVVNKPIMLNVVMTSDVAPSAEFFTK